MGLFSSIGKAIFGQDAMNQFYSGEEIDGVRGKVLQKKMSRSLHFCQLCQNMHALDEECEQ